MSRSDYKTLHEGYQNSNIAYKSFTIENYENPQAEYRLKRLHKILKINHGTFDEEFPEQMMASLFINGDEKVLEIGGNIGRNSLIISKLLHEEKNLVVLESCLENAKILEENRNLNNLSFNISLIIGICEYNINDIFADKNIILYVPIHLYYGYSKIYFDLI